MTRFAADRPLNLAPATAQDYRELARRRLPRQLFDYVDGGAYDEVTMRSNVADLQRKHVVLELESIDGMYLNLYQPRLTSDAGVAFIKPCFSKLASSPTKYAEYLACGLPLIINQGIGDSDTLITREKAGVLLRDFSQSDYRSAIAALEDFVVQPEQTRRRNREVAERLFDVRRVGVERYAHLYERVLGTIN